MSARQPAIGRAALLLVAALLPCAAGMALAGAAPVTVPSGMPVAFHDMLSEASTPAVTYRFRFVAPQIAGAAAPSYEEVAADMDSLCQDYAAPALDGTARHEARVVISLMAEPVAFGEASPTVRQYFEAYTLRDGLCIWEAF